MGNCADSGEIDHPGVPSKLVPQTEENENAISNLQAHQQENLSESSLFISVDGNISEKNETEKSDKNFERRGSKQLRLSDEQYLIKVHGNKEIEIDERNLRQTNLKSGMKGKQRVCGLTVINEEDGEFSRASKLSMLNNSLIGDGKGIKKKQLRGTQNVVHENQMEDKILTKTIK